MVEIRKVKDKLMVCTKAQGAQSKVPGKNKSIIWRSSFFVKHSSSESAVIQVGRNIIKVPKNLLGKRVKLVAEVVNFSK